MRCKQVQMHLGSDEPTHPAISQHLDSCGDCAAFSRFQEQLTLDAASWRDEVPSSFLHDRVQAAVVRAQAGTKHSSRWSVIGQLAVAGAVVALALTYVPNIRPTRNVGSPGALGAVALVFTGGGSAEADFITMKQNVAKATHAYVELWVADYLKPLHRVQQSWWKPGALRIAAGPNFGGDRLFLDENGAVMSYQYSYDQHKMILIRETSFQPMFKEMGHASLEDLIRSYDDGIRGLEIGPEVATEGAIQIVATSDAGYHQFVFLLNKNSRLPIRLTMQHKELGQWLPYLRLNFDFDGKIPNRLFEPADLALKP